jgi:hypothetical protein
MKKSGTQKSNSPSQLIDARITELGDWRGKMLSRLRALVTRLASIGRTGGFTASRMSYPRRNLRRIAAVASA